ncbi:MAG TPA: hypothetical protein VJU77_13835 [Chthoniobacterales bacterium]|nr:hypothetical protein [Chthoniobacterales bacterium]
MFLSAHLLDIFRTPDYGGGRGRHQSREGSRSMTLIDDDGTVLSALVDGKAQLLFAGQPAVSLPVDSVVRALPSRGGELVFLQTKAGRIVAWDVRSGREAWSRESVAGHQTAMDIAVRHEHSCRQCLRTIGRCKYGAQAPART